jgi:phage gp36-like protein
MAYSTEADFNALGLPALALDGVTDTSQWRDAAQGQINSYLRGRYRLPLVAPYPAEVIDVECKLAAYSFISIRGFDPEAGANQNVVLRYKDARDWLKALSEGKVSLDVDADQTPARAEGGPIVASRTRGRTGGSGGDCGFWGNSC